MCRFPLAEIIWDWWEAAEIDLSRVNENGHNLLSIAARAGSLIICEKLVERGIDVNARFKGGSYGSAQVAAVFSGYADVVKYLVEAGADVNTLLNEGEGKYDCALEAAVKHGAVDVVRYLVHDARADINIPLPRSQTGHVLGEAAALPNVEILKILLDAGADVNTVVPGQKYGSALAAACSGQFNNVKCLIQAGADANMQFQGGYGCALLQACISDPGLEIAKYLINDALQGARSDISEHIAWIRRRYNNEEDVQFFSEEWGDEKPAIVEFLQEHGVGR
ncbi:ankyrin repeat-containing domain protein [Aspergillus crustosus]